MASITVFFTTGSELTLEDETDKFFRYKVEDGHLTLTESCRRIPGKADGLFKDPRPIHVYPPGVWREVEVNYER